jgi:rare lipoprotein A
MSVSQRLAAALGVAVVLLVVVSCRLHPAAPEEAVDAPLLDAEPARAPAAQESRLQQFGVASYYARRHHGRRTANGERFDMDQLTAAHRTLPFGTVVRVTDVASGRSVTVRINDRGPYAAGRVIDLSRAAARQLGILEAGVAKVQLDVLTSAASAGIDPRSREL